MTTTYGYDGELVPDCLLEAGPKIAGRRLMQYLETIGDKSTPTPLPHGGQCHMDNVFVEMASGKPLSTAQQLVDHFVEARNTVSDMLNGAVLHNHLSYIEVNSDGWADQYPDLYEHYRTFGCDPDHALDMKEKLGRERMAVPYRVLRSRIRECGGHFHVDLPQHLIDNPYGMAHFVYVFDNLLHHHHGAGEWRQEDTDELALRHWYRRRYLFRPKPYGVEYRSLGPEWLGNLERTETLIECAVKAIREVA